MKENQGGIILSFFLTCSCFPGLSWCLLNYSCITLSLHTLLHQILLLIQVKHCLKQLILEDAGESIHNNEEVFTTMKKWHAKAKVSTQTYTLLYFCCNVRCKYMIHRNWVIMSQCTFCHWPPCLSPSFSHTWSGGKAVVI